MTTPFFLWFCFFFFFFFLSFLPAKPDQTKPKPNPILQPGPRIRISLLSHHYHHYHHHHHHHIFSLLHLSHSLPWPLCTIYGTLSTLLSALSHPQAKKKEKTPSKKKNPTHVWCLSFAPKPSQSLALPPPLQPSVYTYYTSTHYPYIQQYINSTNTLLVYGTLFRATETWGLSARCISRRPYLSNIGTLQCHSYPC